MSVLSSDETGARGGVNMVEDSTQTYNPIVGSGMCFIGRADHLSMRTNSLQPQS
jgi:hypothetical protein